MPPKKRLKADKGQKDIGSFFLTSKPSEIHEAGDVFEHSESDGEQPAIVSTDQDVVADPQPSTSTSSKQTPRRFISFCFIYMLDQGGELLIGK